MEEENNNEEIVEQNDVSTGETVGNEQVVEETTEIVEVDNQESNIDTEINPEETEQEQEEEVSTPEEPPKIHSQQAMDRMANRIIARERTKYENDTKKLINTLNAGGFEGKDIETITNELLKHYESEGIKVSQPQETLSNRQIMAIAKADAEEIIELGDATMVQRFTELQDKIANNTITKTEYQEMGYIADEYAIRNARNEVKKLGIDPRIIDSPEFKKFAKRYAHDVPVTEVVKDFREKYGQKPQKPPSAGSVSTTHVDASVNYSNMSKADFEKEIQRVKDKD